ncbi:hypothetical protein BpHYR1_040770 [Brachionus plicatilis]|uniref:Uncharacterized protein n=1 Tax=Brachionus plicatilis TaxID=10195 RepID=A0A3M7Q2A9_BRAPC|nr:hypothetical protein BpHYR1_040770 [Brachionus plicatilis]
MQLRVFMQLLAQISLLKQLITNNISLHSIFLFVWLNFTSYDNLKTGEPSINIFKINNKKKKMELGLTKLNNLNLMESDLM